MSVEPSNPITFLLCKSVKGILFCMYAPKNWFVCNPILYNKFIPFAVAYKDIKTGDVFIKEHNLCKNGKKEPIVIIGSPIVIKEYLSGKDDQESILFLDEPTIGADNINSTVLHDNILLIMNCTKRTILSSATFPKLEHLKNIIKSYTVKYGSDTYVGNIHSNDILIGCDLKTYNGSYVIPHTNIKNKEELNIVISSITYNGFLSRPYTHNVLKILYTKMTNLNIENVANINDFFMKIENISVYLHQYNIHNLLNLSYKLHIYLSRFDGH